MDIATLRTIANNNGISARNMNGKYLTKAQLLRKLQIGGGLKDRRGFTLAPLLPIKVRTVEEIWTQYQPLLSKYYDTHPDVEFTYEQTLGSGSNKLIHLSSNGKYVTASLSNPMQLATEFENHCKVLLKYYETAPHSFIVPNVYLVRGVYVMDYVPSCKAPQKLKTESETETEIVDFFITNGMNPVDVEICKAVDGQTHVIDFGNVKF